MVKLKKDLYKPRCNTLQLKLQGDCSEEIIMSECQQEASKIT